MAQAIASNVKATVTTPASAIVMVTPTRLARLPMSRLPMGVAPANTVV